MALTRSQTGFVFLLLALFSPVLPARANEAAAPASVTMSPAELFAFAQSAQDAGDFKTAEEAYRALATNPEIELRTEARFRLAIMLADKLGNYREAAVLLRQILDEKPDAARVRVELARMQAQLGNRGAAERELRAAQAIGLPPAVEQMVRFYAAALNAARPYGLNFEVALAPDSNINRGTRSETLGTIIGDFDLSDDAHAKSGLGLSTRGQAWARLGLQTNLDLAARISTSADFYRHGSFDDYALSIQLGPQLHSGTDQIDLAAVASRRWFGQKPYNDSYGGNFSFGHPLGKRGRLRLDGSAVRSDDRLNDLRDSYNLALAASVDRAFTARFGGGLTLLGQRQLAKDPAYSAVVAASNGYLFHEFGKTTLAVNGGYSHLEADKRIFLYPRRRVDDRLSAGASATFRSLRVGSFAPIVRLQYERNFSTIEIYDYRRVSADIGITAAF